MPLAGVCCGRAGDTRTSVLLRAAERSMWRAARRSRPVACRFAAWPMLSSEYHDAVDAASERDASERDACKRGGGEGGGVAGAAGVVASVEDEVCGQLCGGAM
eukprot:4458087-Prymnesium_polylepis.1